MVCIFLTGVYICVYRELVRQGNAIAQQLLQQCVSLNDHLNKSERPRVPSESQSSDSFLMYPIIDLLHTLHDYLKPLHGLALNLANAYRPPSVASNQEGGM